MDDNSKTEQEPEVETIIQAVVDAIVQDRLLLFVGTGFSRAVLNWENKVRKQIPGWLDLLEMICSDQKLSPSKFLSADRNLKFDCPAIATDMAKEVSGTSQLDQQKVIKESAAKQTVWVPRKKHCRKIGALLRNLNPSAIVTTNYDEVLEGLLGDWCKSLSRRDKVQVPMRTQISVWHFHGKGEEHENLVLTREDYLEFFRPGNYAQTKLSQLLHDHFTLFVGYSLSDINLLTALDWAENVYQTKGGFLGYETIKDSTCHALFKRQELLQRVVIDYAKECTQPESGKRLSDSSAVIRTSDVIQLLDDISIACKRNRHDRNIPEVSFVRRFTMRGHYNIDNADALVASLSSPPEWINKLKPIADKYREAPDARMSIIATLREVYRRASFVPPRHNRSMTWERNESVSFLVGMLLEFPLGEMPIACRIRFLEALEQCLDNLKSMTVCSFFQGKANSQISMETLRKNLAWVRQVGLYSGFNRCALFARCCLKHLELPIVP